MTADYDLAPVEFDPFELDEVIRETSAINSTTANKTCLRKQARLILILFAGPEILLIAPATESQTEIWTSCLIGGDAAKLCLQ